MLFVFSFKRALPVTCASTNVLDDARIANTVAMKMDDRAIKLFSEAPTGSTPD